MEQHKTKQSRTGCGEECVSAKSALNNNDIATVALPSENVQNILYMLPMSTFAIVTVSLPLWSLVFCFCTACLFQHDSVTDTECHVSHRQVHCSVLIVLFVFPLLSFSHTPSSGSGVLCNGDRFRGVVGPPLPPPPWF